MTEEQIQKNAELYARYSSRAYNTAYYAHIAGAHSRDEEIRQLHNVINDYSETIDKLRNPWISVEERLPELSNKESSFSSEAVYVRIKSENGFIYYDVATYYPKQKDWCIKNDQDKVTHWQPIQKLKEDE